MPLFVDEVYVRFTNYCIDTINTKEFIVGVMILWDGTSIILIIEQN